MVIGSYYCCVCDKTYQKTQDNKEPLRDICSLCNNVAYRILESEITDKITFETRQKKDK